jgi:hypothetical protein
MMFVRKLAQRRDAIWNGRVAKRGGFRKNKQLRGSSIACVLCSRLLPLARNHQRCQQQGRQDASSFHVHTFHLLHDKSACARCNRRL